MNSIKDISDEKVRKLAETLRQSGLAASETEAVRMALNMTNTVKKVNQTFDEKKDKNIMGLSNLNKQSNQTQSNHSTTSSTSSESINHNPRPVQQPTQYKQPVQREAPKLHEQHQHQVHPHKAEMLKKEEDCECEPGCECGHDCDCSYYEEHDDVEEIEQELVEKPKKEEKTAPKEEPKKEVPAKTNTLERAPPKKDISQMQESKVDLTKVFGFKK